MQQDKEPNWKSLNILTLHYGGMIDEVDRSLGSFHWGWPPNVGHPECFHAKGQLYLLWSGFVTHVCVCTSTTNVKSWHTQYPLKFYKQATKQQLKAESLLVADLQWFHFSPCCSNAEVYSKVYQSTVTPLLAAVTTPLTTPTSEAVSQVKFQEKHRPPVWGVLLIIKQT